MTLTNAARRVLTVAACALAGLGLVALLPLLASPGEVMFGRIMVE